MPKKSFTMHNNLTTNSVAGHRGLAALVTIFAFIFFSNKSMMFISNQFIAEPFSTFLFLLLFYVLYLTFKFPFVSMLNADFRIMSFLLFSTLLLMCFSFYLVDSFAFLIFFELTVFPMFFLIMKFSKGEEKIKSIFFMLYFNLVGSMPFFFYYRQTEGVSSLNNLPNSMDFGVDYFLTESTFVYYILIFFTKIPLLFLHFWLPKAHTSASGICSMILASLVLKLGTFGLLKFFNPFSLISKNFLSFFLSLGLTTTVIMSLIMYRYFDLKNLVAYSSILHMALICPLIFYSSSYSVVAVTMMMVGHGVVSYFLFYLVTVMYESSQSRSTSVNKSSESVDKMYSMMFYFMMFLNLGVPPFINFYSEMYSCSVLSKMSLISVLVFSGAMIVSIFFTIMICSSTLYSKKNQKLASPASTMDVIMFFGSLAVLSTGPLVL